MNAFTASDFTAYPFPTLNDKDFSNLLSVYLDATFSKFKWAWLHARSLSFDFEKSDTVRKINFEKYCLQRNERSNSSISSQVDQG